MRHTPPLNPRMRTTLRCLLILLLSLTATIASAWSIELYLSYHGVSPSRRSESVSSKDATSPILGDTMYGFGYREYHLYRDTTAESPPSLTPIPSWAQRPDPNPDSRAGSCAYGFPLLCLKWDYSIELTSTPASNSSVRHAYPLSLANGTFRSRLPLYPIFPAFLINTLLYAAIFSSPWVFRARRRHLRLRRGHCPNCNYNLLHDHTNRCPECGR